MMVKGIEIFFVESRVFDPVMILLLFGLGLLLHD